MKKQREKSGKSDYLKPEKLDPIKFLKTLWALIEDRKEFGISELCKCANRCSTKSKMVCNRFATGEPSSFELQKWFQKQEYFQFFHIAGKVDNKYEIYTVVSRNGIENVLNPIEIRPIDKILADIEEKRRELGIEENNTTIIVNNMNMENEEKEAMFIPDVDSIRRTILILQWIKIKRNDAGTIPSIRKTIIETLGLPLVRRSLDSKNTEYHSIYQEAEETMTYFFGEGTLKFDTSHRPIIRVEITDDLDTAIGLLIEKLPEGCKPYELPEEKPKEETPEAKEMKKEAAFDKEVVLCVIEHLIYENQEMTLPESEIRTQLYKRGFNLEGVLIRDVLDTHFKSTLMNNEKGVVVDAWTYEPAEIPTIEKVVEVEKKSDNNKLILSTIGRNLEVESMGAEFINGAELKLIDSSDMIMFYEVRLDFNDKQSLMKALKMYWRKEKNEVNFIIEKKKLAEIMEKVEKAIVG